MFNESSRLRSAIDSASVQVDVAFSRQHLQSGAGGPVSTGLPAAVDPLLLDIERVNRNEQASSPDQWTPLSERIKPGEVILRAARSGGPFDRYGARKCDVYRAQDLTAMTEHLPGRWLFITFTINRALFLSPELAYDRGNERIRKVMAQVAPKGIYFSAFEVQTKTGEGWPHWHVLAWVPDGRSDAELVALTRRLWCMKTSEEVDKETGEVTRMSERVSLGFITCETARNNVAAGAYVGKYLTKPFGAVPEWMGDSRRRFRKLRFSMNCYDVLERMHRHDRQRGSRREAQSRRPHRKTRRLFERIAAGGCQLNAFRVDSSGRLRFLRSVPVSFDMIESRLVPAVSSLRSLRLGTPGRCVFACLRSDLNGWLERCCLELQAEAHEELRRRFHQERSRWSKMQRERASGQSDAVEVGIGDGSPDCK